MSLLSYIRRSLARSRRLALRAWHLLRHEGLGGALAVLRRRRHYRQAQQAIDATCGTETLESLAIAEFAAQGENAAFAYEYHPTPALPFAEILADLPIACRDYVFIDLGCGKGLAMMLAATFGFARILGVEFEPKLYATAVANLDKFRSQYPTAPPIEVHHGDAADYALPAAPITLYLYNPFGPEVIRKVLASLRRTLAEQPRSCWVIYVNPLHHDLFVESGFLQMHVDKTNREFGESYAIYHAS